MLTGIYNEETKAADKSTSVAGKLQLKEHQFSISARSSHALHLTRSPVGIQMAERLASVPSGHLWTSYFTSAL
jgi:hypothetical protein